jgi:hypothetical protein
MKSRYPLHFEQNYDWLKPYLLEFASQSNNRNPQSGFSGFSDPRGKFASVTPKTPNIERKMYEIRREKELTNMQC